MSRITLITYFDEKQLDIISKFLENINLKMCKVPYGINDNKRYEIDNLPYHFTIFATDKINQNKLLEIAKNTKMEKIKLKIKPFSIEFNKLALYDYPGEIIETIEFQKNISK